MDIRTQDLSIADQLTYGVRMLEITVRLENGKLEIYSSGIALNKTLFNALVEIEQFLHFHSRELVILVINYDDHYFLDWLDGILTKLDLCMAIDEYNHVIAGWRLVKNWDLDETIDKYRGKILLATNDFLFEDCIHSIRHECLTSKDIVLSDTYAFSDTISQKWNRYFKLNQNCYFFTSFCFFYDMSFDVLDQYAYVKKGYNRRDVTAFGYYDNVENKCYKPLNYIFINNDIPDCIFKLNIFNFEFITMEIIDHVDKMN
ncbi:GSCOCG00013364001-RA-CDS, partial [Cotesia congregata]